MTQRNANLILNARTSAETYPEITLLDYRFDQNPTRGIAGSLTTGDSIILQVSPCPLSGASGDVWVTVGVYTSTTFADVFHGPWPRARVQKAGTAGAATVWIVG